MINQISIHGEGRAPRSILMLGGTQIDWTSWDMEHNGVHEAGTISIDVPVEFADWPWWTQQTEIIIDVFAGFPKDPQNYSTSDLTLLMTARIDEIRLNPEFGSITLDGRDLTSLLTDQKSDAKYPNMTSSAIAIAIAKQYGLHYQVQDTKELVGHFYTSDHVRMQHQTTPWTLLCYLAQHEGLQCFILGRVLYFGAFGTTFSNEPYLIQYNAPTVEEPFGTSNVENLHFIRDMTLAQDISVRVRSFHGAKNAAYSATAKANKTLKRLEKHAVVAQSVQQYDYTFPGFTQAQCQAKADQILKELSKHELKFNARAPGDALIFPWTPIQVRGTNTLFDTQYQAARVRRSFRVGQEGFCTELNCKTAPAQETVTLS